MPLDLLCVDADDTLWPTMRHFDAAERAVYEMLAPFADENAARRRFEEVTGRNLQLYGYGAKSFTLSMIQTATELCGDTIPRDTVAAILEAGRELLCRPVELFDGVAETLVGLAGRVRLVLVTKGDLINQEAKLAGSGLGEHFEGVEIVSDKTAATFTRLFARYGVRPDRAGMAGDSLRSDIVPAIEAGAWAAYIAPEMAWSHELVEAPLHHRRFAALDRFAQLPAWIDDIDRSGREG